MTKRWMRELSCVEIFQDRKSKKEQLKLQKVLAEKISKIEKRQPILDILNSDGVKAAYEESRKRKCEAEEERALKRARNEQVNIHIAGNIILRVHVLCGKLYISWISGKGNNTGRGHDTHRLLGRCIAKETNRLGNGGGKPVQNSRIGSTTCRWERQGGGQFLWGESLPCK